VKPPHEGLPAPLDALGLDCEVLANADTLRSTRSLEQAGQMMPSAAELTGPNLVKSSKQSAQ